MTPTLIVAIDPGVTGAIAFYAPEQNRVAVYDMPIVGYEVDPFALRELIVQHGPDSAIIERVGPMPRDGVRQAWRFSAAYATARTVVALEYISMTLVSPAQWKKALNVPGGPEGKEICRAKAIQFFPASAGSFARKKDAGRAEAALLAVYSTTLPRLGGGNALDDGLAAGQANRGSREIAQATVIEALSKPAKPATRT